MRIEIHYLPSIEYFTLLLSQEQVQFEVHEHFQKQTYRNRALILGANGVETLTVPIQHVHSGKLLMKDVRIDYDQNWLRIHQGAIQAAYGKAPYFEYFEPYIRSIFAKKLNFLVDLNIEYLELFGRILGKKWNYSLSESFEIEDKDVFWNHILAKQDWRERNVYQELAYPQCFGNTFQPNLSVLDLLMNQGRDANLILNQLNKK
ncbi:WbqC family protein [Aquirufa aurantiipilula]|uniref:WbqC family protein n=1 Tax=Aquirufa aurantiipilula TaxID=2696561 RepID=A0ABT6BI08_9BACT|nr:WbqC family protein [Aquirufa aurantiipilula]MDF5689835.1 WbqC family protein [Aquirufa aurantiipilula]